MQRRKIFKHKAFDDINLTPVLDVMLTILVAFILIAPNLKHGIVSDIPKAKGKAIKAKKMVIISISSKNEFYINKKKYSSFQDIENKLSEIHKENPKIQIYLEGSKESKYGSFVKILSILKKVGFKNINMATKPR